MALTEFERQDGRRYLIPFTRHTYRLYQAEPAHHLIAQHLQAVCRGEILRLMILAPPQHGKLLAHGTPVPTPDGWTTHGELMPGDYVLGRYGEPVRVLAIGNDGVANRAVEFSDGTTILCHGQHGWLVHSKHRHHIDRVYTTDEMRAEGVWNGPVGRRGGRAVFQIDGNQEIELPERELPVPPYVLGAWLGDGSTTRSCIHSAPDDIAIHREFERLGCEATGVTVHADTGVVTRYYRRLYGELVSSGLLGDKHIPDEYLVASVRQRLELLAGLLDTDGYVYRRNGRVTFSTADSALVRDVTRLVASLGWRVTQSWTEPAVSTSGIEGKLPVCQVTFNPTRQIPCKLKRKRNRKANPRQSLRSIKAIREIEPVPGRCIQVEGGVYLVGDTMIPTHNSELASVRFPAYWLAHRPEDPVILTSYGASLATNFSRQARDVVESAAFKELFPAIRTNQRSRAADQWGLAGHRGELVAAGVGGPITGHGAMLGIIDDPFENWEQAYSETVRDRVWEWWRGTFRTRIWEGGAILLICTRWHEDDLAGRLLQTQGDRWVVLRLPAMAETQEERDQAARKLNQPPGQPDPLGREPGEPLCPDRFSKAALEEIKTDVGTMAWFAEYQGVPTNPEGSIFKRQWFEIVDAAPADPDDVVRYWDKAGTEGDGARTAGVRMSRKGHTYYVENVVKGQFGSLSREKVLKQTAMIDGRRVRIWLEQEPGSGGKESAENTIRNLAGFDVRSETVSGSKEVRARPFAAQCEAGNVKLVRGAWNGEYIEELVSFPAGTFADQVDASSGAFNKLALPDGDDGGFAF